MDKKKIFISSVQSGLARPMFVQDDDFLLTLYRRTSQDTAQVTAQDNPLNDSEIDYSTAQVKVEVTAQVIRLLRILGDREMNKAELMKVLGMSHVENFRLTYLQPALKAGLIEMTIPDKPNSRLQKYRRTGKELNFSDAKH